LVARAERSRQNGLSLYGVNAVEERAATQLQQARNMFDMGTARELAWLFSLLARGDSVYAYSEIQKLDLHLTNSVTPELLVCVRDVASRHMKPDTPADELASMEALVKDLERSLVKRMEKLIPGSHWSMTSVWDMIEAIAGIVKAQAAKDLSTASFLSVSLDEASQRGSSYLSVHAYYVNEEWELVPLFLKLAHVTKAPNSEYLLALLLKTLGEVAETTPEDLTNKVCATVP